MFAERLFGVGKRLQGAKSCRVVMEVQSDKESTISMYLPHDSPRQSRIFCSETFWRVTDWSYSMSRVVLRAIDSKHYALADHRYNRWNPPRKNDNQKWIIQLFPSTFSSSEAYWRIRSAVQYGRSQLCKSPLRRHVPSETMEKSLSRSYQKPAPGWPGAERGVNRKILNR